LKAFSPFLFYPVDRSAPLFSTGFFYERMHMSCNKFWPILALSWVCSQSAFAQTQPATKPIITLASAKAAVSSSTLQAPAGRAPFVISVVDDGGHLIYLERSDGVASGMVEASIQKAKAAALYGFSTKVIEQQIIQGHPGFQSLPDILPMEGGVPVLIDGKLVGAVGVAGGLSPDDGTFAEKTAAMMGNH
jgi:glc operon protein GlcG